MKNKPDDILNINELSDYLKVSRSTLYKVAREGRIPSQKIGRHWRFHRKAIDDWIRNRNQKRKSYP